MADDYTASVEAWRRKMDERLREPTGWLSLAGLFWLHEGSNLVGSDPASDVRLPAGAASLRVGRIELKGPTATLHVTGGDAVRVDGVPMDRIELVPDVGESPTYVDLGELRLVVIRRGERLGVRLWDARRPERKAFAGRRWFPIDLRWRVPATFVPHEPPLTLQVPNVLGEIGLEEGIGRVVFDLSGEACTLEAIRENGDELFLIFADPTNREATYPSGRFLYAEASRGGRVVLDFNRAYSPPCAFTAFATCPLPPAENHLAIPIPAGELYPRPASAQGGRG